MKPSRLGVWYSTMLSRRMVLAALNVVPMFAEL
ncbi:Uncharacterised protein [Bordetella pertussis]|nr:Uncharacterised protein [Bordetella pertussis]CFP65238.1 Uncharacterised protein [Bordetella pertussis]CFW49043.1 Uncharacterised protein [Bordetella pertussis]